MNKKKMENKGFTLVELIVVLVILAILAAILVPALLGYIDRAKEKQYVLNAKSALTATQAEFSSIYGEGDDVVDSSNKFSTTKSTIVKKTADTPTDTHFYVFLNPNLSTITDSNYAIPDNHKRYTVENAYYVQGSYYCVYNGKTWTTTTTKPTAPSGTTEVQIY